jgi:hypothetical protein
MDPTEPKTSRVGASGENSIRQRVVLVDPSTGSVVGFEDLSEDDLSALDQAIALGADFDSRLEVAERRADALMARFGLDI